MRVEDTRMLEWTYRLWAQRPPRMANESGVVAVLSQVATPWNDIRKEVMDAVTAASGRTVDELRFADGSGGSIGV